MKRVLAGLVSLLLALLPFTPTTAGTDDHGNAPQPWILIDSNRHTLSVIHNGEIQVRFYDISIGRGGIGQLRTMGDSKTPVGEFEVGWINHDSRYTLFFGLNFPNLDYARRAYESQLIGDADFAAIRTALVEGRTPPQDTPLGGNLGIHGIGKAGNPTIHTRFNWTDGCIALTDQQVAVLAKWIDLGTKVIIQ